MSASHSDPFNSEFQQGRVPIAVSRFQRHGAVHAVTAVHPFAVIIFVEQGVSRVRHTAELELHAGDVHLIPPGDAHGSAHFDRMSGWNLGLWPEQSPEALRLFTRVRHGCHPVLHPTSAQWERLERWLVALEEECAASEPSRERAMGALLTLILVELERANGSPLHEASEATSLARQALEYVELHALRPLSLEDVARAVGRTSAHVASVVRRETGRTVGEWILMQRMGEARRRLRGTDASMEVIAREVGYADVTHFIRQFRKVHGQTPAQWRRAQQQAR